MLLNKANLDAIVASSTSSLRPVLNCLKITTEKTVATDSYILIEVTNPSDLPEAPDVLQHNNHECLVYRKAIEKALKNQVKYKALPVLECWATSVDGNKCTITTTDLEVTQSVQSNISDGQFPNYEAVIPKGKPVATVGINANMLKRLLKYFEDHAVGKHVLLEVYDDRTPLLLSAKTESGQFIRAICMPLLNAKDRSGDFKQEVIIDEPISSHE